MPDMSVTRWKGMLRSGDDGSESSRQLMTESVAAARELHREAISQAKPEWVKLLNHDQALAVNPAGLGDDRRGRVGVDSAVGKSSRLWLEWAEPGTIKESG